MKHEFYAIKDAIEQTIMVKRGGKEQEVCRVSQYSDAVEVYITAQKNNQSKAVFVEVSFNENRDTELVSHFCKSSIDTIVMRNLSGLKDIKVGKTPPKIKRLFTDHSKSYKEAGTMLSHTLGKVYFSVRLIEDEKDVELRNGRLGKKTSEYFLISFSLYDPASLNDEVYLPLHTIYSIKVKCDI